MAFSLVHTVGLDDRGVDEGLRRIESRTAQTMRAMGDQARFALDPFNKFTRSVLGASGLIAAFKYTASEAISLGRAIGTALFDQGELTRRAREEAEQRERSVAAIDKQIGRMNQQLGLAAPTPNQDAAAALVEETKALDPQINDAANKARDAERAYNAATERLRAREREAQREAERSRERATGTARPNLYSGGNPYADALRVNEDPGVIAAKENAQAALAIMQRANGELNALQERRRSAVEQLRVAAALDQQAMRDAVGRLSTDTAVGSFRARGMETDAAMAQERARFAADRRTLESTRARFEALEAGGMLCDLPTYQQQSDAIERRHAQEMEAIRRRGEAQRETNALDRLELDAVLAKERGQGRLARALEEQLSLRRMILSIEQNSTLTEAERQDRIRVAAQISERRLRDLDGGSGGFGAGVAPGIGVRGNVLGQVFRGTGGGDRPAQEQTAVRHLEVANEIVRSIKDIARNGVKTTARAG